MNKIAVIGAGMSGLSVARMLQEKGFKVTVFDKSAKPGGLVKCDRVQDNLFHRVGGHVFNAKNKQVSNWFWSQFDQEKEFRKTKRNAKILFNHKLIGYPIENYLYQLEPDLVSTILDELLALSCQPQKQPEEYQHFGAFLRGNFGDTLYEQYFQPYNHKIWNTDLSKVPLGWLEGKLPMPNCKQTLMSNIIQQEESTMVHSTFYYAKEEGSQFIANRLSEGLHILYGQAISHFKPVEGGWQINDQVFDQVVYTGDIRELHNLMPDADPACRQALKEVTDLRANGTSNIFCETDETDLSWLYLPDPAIKAHRIIYTGNFSETNNRGSRRKTCAVEFSGKVNYEIMQEQIKTLPGNLTPLDYNYEPNSYVVQYHDTPYKISTARQKLQQQNFYLLGRFAEWQYYNMDKAIEAAMDLSEKIS